MDTLETDLPSSGPLSTRIAEAFVLAMRKVVVNYVEGSNRVRTLRFVSLRHVYGPSLIGLRSLEINVFGRI